MTTQAFREKIDSMERTLENLKIRERTKKNHLDFVKMVEVQRARIRGFIDGYNFREKEGKQQKLR